VIKNFETSRRFLETEVRKSQDYRNALNLEVIELMIQRYKQHLKTILGYFHTGDESVFVNGFTEDPQDLVEGLEDVINLYEIRKMMERDPEA
jgi:hypothetical protein